MAVRMGLVDSELWGRVDTYLEDALAEPDEVLASALRSSAEAGLPAIQVSALQGKFLHVLAVLMGARRVLEIGSLGGYSAIWMARALPADGKTVGTKGHDGFAVAVVGRAQVVRDSSEHPPPGGGGLIGWQLA